ncbi:efflux RND transporter permease subunit [Martelella mediterranea]|uniref:Efflux pump membrane transporter n=1 Tax=Martelella mediterranea TaxID=293089 RepID=A0A4R3NUB6_9HYPH|nr:efflux RND transporter permease subunit [Martelella mediterranea]TCT41747.1 multidrug efflux pump [Martelella mediterranea]
MANFFINRPVFAWVIAIVIMLIGGLGISQLPISQYPQIAPTTISLTATYPGASARTVETTVTNVIEEGLTGFDDMLYLTSTSSPGLMQISVIFGPEIDPEIAQVEVQNKLQLVQPQLPDIVRNLGITVDRSSSSFLMVVALTDSSGTYSAADLGNIIDSSINDGIARLDGVGSVQGFYTPYAMRIWLDPYKLNQYNMTVSDVANAIQAQNQQVAVGDIGNNPSVKGQQLSITAVSAAQLENVSEFEGIVLKTTENGANVTLSDVGRVELGQRYYQFYTYYNGVPAAGFAVELANGANAIDTSKRVTDFMDSIKPSLPQGVDVIYPYDTTPFVELSIEQVVHTLFEAIVLVFVVLLVFLQNLRATLIATIVVPVVLLGAFGVLSFAGFSINTLTMFAMVLAIGLLVDDAIVVVENVERIMHEEGLPPKEATQKSMGEIQGALIGIVMVLTAVFIPMAFIGGSTGIIYRQFSISIVAAMVLSVLVAMIFTPALCATMLKPVDPTKKDRGLSGVFNRGFERVTNAYTGTVSFLLKWPLPVFAVFGVLLFAVYHYFVQLPDSFLPDEDQGSLFTIVNLPTGATTERTQAVTDQVAAYFRDQESDAVDAVFTVLGFSFAGQGQNYAMAFIQLKPFEDRTNEAETAAAVAQRANGYFYMNVRDAQVYVVQPPAIPGLGQSTGWTGYVVDSGGQGQEATLATTNRIIQQMNTGGIAAQVRTNTLPNETQMKINIDEQKAGSYGVSIAEATGMLSTIYAGTNINNFTLNDKVKKVYVQGDAPYRMQPQDIYRWYARNNQGDMVPFSAFTDLSWTSGAPSLAHFNGNPAVDIQGQTQPGMASGEAMNQLESLVSQAGGGFSVAWTDMSLQQVISGNEATYLYIVSIVFVFLCLAALYESWSIPFSVILAVPVGILGAVMGAHFLGQDNDVYFKVGLLTTMGLAAKNAILIVEFAREQSEKGDNLFDAAVHAARMRLRPIIMTSLAFILGVTPLVLATGAGSAAQNAIGIAVFFGMLAATTLGIFFVPSFFVAVCRLMGIGKKGKDEAEEQQAI